MSIALHIISIFLIAMGTLLIIYTQGSKDFLKKLFLRGKIRWTGIFPLALGGILIAGIFYYKDMFWLGLILGLLGIAKGVFLLFGPEQHMRRIIEWWFLRAGDPTIRFFALINVILGIAILSYLR
jgi:hypothetical protein